MNNREIFINFINTLFNPYIEEIEQAQETVSCDKKAGDFSLLVHQKIVRDYINNYTPYRGLLLYHGLGSGKTCSAIAIAEAIKTYKQIIVMTPASLQTNFLSELKKCGDSLYKYNQYWEFISTDDEEVINQFHTVLKIPRSVIRKNGGAWFVDVRKKSNFTSLTTEEQANLNKQLNMMIKKKYEFLNYNGLRLDHLKTKAIFKNAIKEKRNPFDNTVVIIDEAHNFVSRIINKLRSKQDSISVKLYNYLKTAQNVRLVFLTGTPIINYPNEIAVLFNMLRGSIKTFNINLNIKNKKKVNETFIKKTLEKTFVSDYIQYSSGTQTISITRNPFGFISNYDAAEYKGVLLNEQGNLDDNSFLELVKKTLGEHKIEYISHTIDLYNALPDDLAMFRAKFFDKNNNLINSDLFKRRILGLTSYYRSASEQLLPSLNPPIIERIPMNTYQLGIYESARKQERDREKKDAKKRRAAKKKTGDGEIYSTTSTYRIFSRAFCNFVFPIEHKRPLPLKDEELEDILDKNVGEDLLDNASLKELENNPDGMVSADDIEQLKQSKKETSDRSYGRRITSALKFLKKNESRFLTKAHLIKYSPKFLKMLENIQNPDNIGLNLVYSQFRTLEGIGIFKLVLEANGFVEFKLKRTNITWEIENPENLGQPSFVLYTGTETVEEKEIVRNIFNGTWKGIPSNIAEQLATHSENNDHGEIIKVFMITAAGAEGISLRNVRYVHITEPYWHPIRIEQVIGRARRICSHHTLPEEERNVSVYIYLMTFNRELLDNEGEMSKELKIHDLSKLDKKTPITSDEALYEISNIKEEVNRQLLLSVKEASLDCSIYAHRSQEDLQCFSFGKIPSSIFSYLPSIDKQPVRTSKKHKQLDRKKQVWKGKAIKIDGKKYVMRVYTDPSNKKKIIKREIYDLNSYKLVLKNMKKGISSGEAILLGELQFKAGTKVLVPVWFK